MMRQRRARLEERRARLEERRARLEGAALTCVVAVALGCASAPKDPDAAPATRPEGLSARVLLPLEHDTVFSYVTASDTGEEGLMVLQVRRPRPDLAELDVAGRVQRLDVDAGGVMHAGGGYLLKNPIVPGATFRGAFGEVKIADVERTIEVPAGKFEGCVVTLEESAQPFKRAESTYCPEVGLVALVVEASGEDDALRVETRLKSYGPRVRLR